MRRDIGFLDFLPWIVAGIVGWFAFKQEVKLQQDNCRRDREIAELTRKIEEFRRKKLSS